MMLLHNIQNHSAKKAMDPACTGNCAQDRQNLDEWNPYPLYNSDPEARTGPPECLSPDSGPDCGLQPTEADLRVKNAAVLERKSKDQYGWRRVIRNFSPSYPKTFHTDYSYRHPFLEIDTTLVIWSFT